MNDHDDVRGIEKSRPLILPGWGLSSAEIAVAVGLGNLAMLPPAAELIAPNEKYYADHLSASRHIVTLLWDQTRRGLPGGFRDSSRRLESRLYEAMARLTRAEAAVMQAECIRVRPTHADLDVAKALVESHVQSLNHAEEQIGGAAGLLDEITADNAADARGRGDAKEQPKEKEPAKSLAEDALEQVKLLLSTIKAIVELLAPKKKQDDIAQLIQNLAKAVVSGTQAAIVGAVSALLAAIDSDAEAKDVVIIPGKDGEVTIWFRVRKGCLLIFDWVVDDDYVFVKKTGKGATPTFATGKPAKALEKAVQEALEKKLKESTPPSTPPTTPPSTPKKYF